MMGVLVLPAAVWAASRERRGETPVWMMVGTSALALAAALIVDEAGMPHLAEFVRVILHRSPAWAVPFMVWVAGLYASHVQNGIMPGRRWYAALLIVGGAPTVLRVAFLVLRHGFGVLPRGPLAAVRVYPLAT